MPVLDALFDHIQQISSNVEITGSLVQFAQFRQLMSELGHSRPNWAVRARDRRRARPHAITAIPRQRPSDRFLIFRNSA